MTASYEGGEPERPEQQYGYQQPGYPPQGYEQYGYPPQGYSQQGYSPQPYPQQAAPGYPQTGYEQYPYPQYPYPQGYPQQGYAQYPPAPGGYPVAPGGSYGEPYGSLGAQAEASLAGTKAPLWIGVGVLIALLGVIAVLGFVAPGWFTTTVFDDTAMESDVEQVLADDYEIRGVSEVSCPGGQEVEVDSSFECTAVVGGEERAVPIMVTSAEADYEVGIPE